MKTSLVHGACIKKIAKLLYGGLMLRYTCNATEEICICVSSYVRCRRYAQYIFISDMTVTYITIRRF